MKKQLYLIAIFSCLVYSFDNAQNKESCLVKAEKINLVGFHNLYKINASLYRSEQPDKKGMIELQQIGLLTILNLREFKNDKNEARGTKLILEQIPIKASKISYDDVIKALKIIQQSNKPVLVHCLHGSDRTGCIIAAYRMVYENWPKDEAISEFTDKSFGYHVKCFPNILTLLKSLDIEMMKKDLGI